MVKQSSQPALVDSLAHMPVLDVACGGKHTVCVAFDTQTKANHVYSWGDNSKGQLGYTECSFGAPRRVQFEAYKFRSPLKIDKVAAGHEHTAFLDLDKSLVLGCGETRFGQLGLGKQHEPKTQNLIDILCDKNIVDVAAGRNHTLALSADGSVYAAGLNSSGQLGMDHQETLHSFMKIPKLRNIVQISAGSYSGAVDQEGRLFVWGFWGTSHSLTPKQMRSQEKAQFRKLSVGDGFGVALDYRGKIYGWGSNELGQLGSDFSNTSKFDVSEVPVMSDKGVANDLIAG